MTSSAGPNAFTIPVVFILHLKVPMQVFFILIQTTFIINIQCLM